MNRFTIWYRHPASASIRFLTLEAESQEVAEKETQRRLDERQPLGWSEDEEIISWEPGITVEAVSCEGPVEPDDDEEILF